MSGKLRADPASLLPLARKILGFLEPDPALQARWLETPGLHDPSAAAAVVQAAERLKLAVQQREKVIVAGDYDADGILGTAILTGALRRQGVEAGFYIPDRIREGYGLQEKTVRLAAEKGYGLLVTVDNGVQAHEALAAARAAGLDVIVTDHHQFSRTPDAGWFVHPALMEAPFASLCGAAVAYELIRQAGWDTDYELILAGVASVADQMEVTGQTRALIFRALQLLGTTADPHIRLLAGQDPATETDLSFQVIPKINSLGRLSDMVNANNAVRYFLCSDIRQLMPLARSITEINERRKTMSRQVAAEAEARLVSAGTGVIFLESPSWHEGIIGLAAGSLCEKTGRAVILAARNPGGYKASMRVPEGIDCMQLLAGFDGFTSLGGHARAAGFSLDLDQREAFVSWLETVQVPPAVRKKPVVIDPEDLTVPAIRQLDALRPFGTGFEMPEVSIENPDISCIRSFSGDRHRRYILENGLEAVRFNQPDGERTLPGSRIRALTGKPSVNVWMQAVRPQLILSDVVTGDSSN